MVGTSTRDLLRLMAVCLALLLGGCSGPADPADGDGPGSPEDTADEPTPIILRSDDPFSWTAGVGAPGGQGQNAPADDISRLSVPENVGRFNLTITWTCTTPAPACDLQAYTCEPKSTASRGEPCTVRATGSSPLTIDVLNPTAGEWTFTMRATGADAAVQGNIHSEVRPKTTDGP